MLAHTKFYMLNRDNLVIPPPPIYPGCHKIPHSEAIGKKHSQCHTLDPRSKCALDFQLLCEACGVIVLDVVSTAKPMTVGWGKKETQFRGKEGKPRPEDLRKKV